MRSQIIGLTLLTTTYLLHPSQAVADVVDLDVSFSPARLTETYEEIARLFQAENPDVRIRLAGYPSYDELAQATLRNAVTGSQPDVVHQGFGHVRIYADQGLAASLDPFIDAEANWEEMGYSTAVVETCRIRDAVYCLPFAVSLPVLFYNRSLVERAGGVEGGFPADWDGILDLAERIDGLGPDVSGFYYTVDGNGSYPFQILVSSHGGRMMSPDETAIAFDGPEGAWAFDMIRRFRDAGMPDLTKNQARQMFAAGQLGIFMINSSNIGLLERTSDGRFDIGVAPLPVVDGGMLPTGGNATVLLAEAEDRRSAGWRYMMFVAGPVAQALLAQDTGYVPVNTQALEDRDLVDFYRENPAHLVAAERFHLATTAFSFPGPNALRIQDAAEEALLTVLRDQQVPDAALGELAAHVSDLLETQ